jgi:uncharacterized protein (TIGR00290 family)
MKKKALLSWSSGKDSAWALHLLLQDPAIDLLGLFTVMNEKFDRVSMHSTRRELLFRQAEAIGLPLETIDLPDPCTTETCDAIMRQFVAETITRGIECMAFGDLFLEDVRQYRENQLKGSGIEPAFPLWGIPTGALAKEMLSAGLEAYVSSVDLKRLPARFAGQRWTEELIAHFPQGIDPCGENGEIHTIVVGGPMFRERVPIRIGDVVERNGFVYADIIPMDNLANRSAIVTGDPRDFADT